MNARTLTFLAALAAAAAAIFFSLNSSSEDIEKARLSLTGSSTIAPLALEIAKRYEAQNEGLRIDVETGGSSRGMADARRGLADIGMVSRRLKAEESDLTAHLLARDGVGIIVHASNPIEAITGAEVTSIYKRETRNWQALGGPDADIILVHKAEGRSTLEVFLDHFKLDNPSITPDVIVGDNEQGIKTVAANPAGIGYVSIGTAEVAIENGAAIKLIKLDGIEASTATVADGSFPMARELNLVTHGEIPENAASFIAFAQSADVNDLIKGQSFVPPRR